MKKELVLLIAAHKHLIDMQKSASRAFGDYRIKNKMSLREMGKLCGFSPQHIWDIERGATPMSLETTQKVFEAISK